MCAGASDAADGACAASVSYGSDAKADYSAGVSGYECEVCGAGIYSAE